MTRALLSLLVCPLSLATSFVVAAVVLRLTGTPPEGLGAALEGSPAIPTALGFALSLVVIRRFARADDVRLEDLGWIAPSASDVFLGVVGIVVLLPLNVRWLFPLVRSFDSSFDPQLRALSIPASLLAFTVAVVAEETVYRGYALRQLTARLGRIPAVLIVALGYALLAPGLAWAPKLWAAGFGVLLAVMRLWRGSLWPGAVVHLVVSLGPKILYELG